MSPSLFNPVPQLSSKCFHNMASLSYRSLVELPGLVGPFQLVLLPLEQSHSVGVGGVVSLFPPKVYS